MSTVVVAALLCGLVLGLVALNLVALLRSRSLGDVARREAREARRVQDAAIERLGSRLDALAARVEDVGSVPQRAAAAAAEKSGINLSRRSQALRLHRRGESPGEIAAALGIPVQEVQLLIKVHEIVMSTV
jgi:hypothetical protein